MNDQVVVKKGFGQRFSNSLAALPIGILLLIIGIFMLASNEKKAVTNQKDVVEMRKTYVEVDSKSVDANNNGKLVVTSGKLVYSPSTMTDSTFGVSLETPILERKVEIFEWVEETQESNDSTTYTYTKQWNDDLISSAKFNTPAGHTNPTYVPYDDDSYRTKSLTVGAFTLSEKFVNALSASSDLKSIPGDVKLPEGYKVVGNYITNAADMANPQVGDIRISYKYGDYTDVTVLGNQTDSRIDSFKTKKGSSIIRLEHGILSGDEVITNIENENNMMKWIFRILGTLLIVIGLNMLTSPITNLAAYVPFLGNLVNGAVGLVMFILGLAISLVVIAISWFVVRPLLSIALIAVVIALIYFLRMKSKKTTK